jgi:hypothetical protein
MQVAPARVVPERQHRLFWWKEALIIGVGYFIYSWTRNQFGSKRLAADGIPEQAFDNAEEIIRLERLLGLFHEESMQEFFIAWPRAFIQFWNTYYGVAHFFVTVLVFILLYRKRPAVFPQWRNSIVAMTVLAIVGFALFPLMPPRLLDEPCTDYGGACIASDLREGGSFGFVDTLQEYGGPWNFDSEAVADLSNQYAAMPSLHVGWAIWCAVAMWPLLRRRWQRVAVFLYPLATMFGVIVTGNHYWIDGVGGLVVFGLGTLIGWSLHRWNQNRLDLKHARELEAASTSSASA